MDVTGHAVEIEAIIGEAAAKLTGVILRAKALLDRARGRNARAEVVASAIAVGEFVDRAEMRRAVFDAIFDRIVPTGVLGVAETGDRRAGIADRREP